MDVFELRNRVIREHCSGPLVVGIDPAPAKHAAVWSEAGPFGQGIDGLSLYISSVEMSARGRGFAVEVHPAVALAALWIDSGINAPFPRYKAAAARDVAAVVASRLGFPEEAGVDDDALDAFIAYRPGTQVVSGEACFVGDPAAGGYLLPAGGGATEIAVRISGITDVR